MQLRFEQNQFSWSCYLLPLRHCRLWKLPVTIVPLPWRYRKLEMAGTIFCYRRYFQLGRQYHKNVWLKKESNEFNVFLLLMLLKFCSYLKQTCQSFKVTNLAILAKSLKKPLESVKNLDIFVGHFFRCDQHRELSRGFFFENNIDKRQIKLFLIDRFLWFHK